MREHKASDALLAEQVAYYRAIAPEYESLSIPGAGGDEVVAALTLFEPAGDVLATGRPQARLRPSIAPRRFGGLGSHARCSPAMWLCMSSMKARVRAGSRRASG